MLVENYLTTSVGRWAERSTKSSPSFAAINFTIAFKNDSYPGYTTEKIYEPMYVNSLPIYSGNPLVYRDFNPATS